MFVTVCDTAGTAFVARDDERAIRIDSSRTMEVYDRGGPALALNTGIHAAFSCCNYEHPAAKAKPIVN